MFATIFVGTKMPWNLKQALWAMQRTILSFGRV